MKMSWRSWCEAKF